MTRATDPAARGISTTVTETVDVDVDVSAEDLHDAGWHHETECTTIGPDASEVNEALANLRDWHDQAHGMVLWVSCKLSPCSVIPVGAR